MIDERCLEKKFLKSAFFSLPESYFGASIVLNDLELAVAGCVQEVYRDVPKDEKRVTERYELLGTWDIPEWSGGPVIDTVLRVVTLLEYRGANLVFKTEEFMHTLSGDISCIVGTRERNAREGSDAREYRHKLLTITLDANPATALQYHVQRDDPLAFGRSENCSPSVDGFVVRYLSKEQFGGSTHPTLLESVRKTFAEYPSDGALVTTGVAPHLLQTPTIREYSFVQEARLTCSLKELVADLVRASKSVAERRAERVSEEIPF